jgi:hypothetical protein
MKRTIFIAAIGFTAFATACTTPAGGSQMAANVGPDGEPLVCRSMQVIGTRFPQKECKTAEAWEQYDAYTKDNAKESTDKFQRIQSGAATNAGG